MKKGEIFSINISKTKGVIKTPVKKGLLIAEHGLENDAHAGDELRQVSLLPIESIIEQRECIKVKTKGISLSPGDFAENITTKGINLSNIKIGYKLKIGSSIILEISKIGKECHKYCAVYEKIGSCIMPKQGVFAKVIKGGEISVGDKIEVIENV